MSDPITKSERIFGDIAEKRSYQYDRAHLSWLDVHLWPEDLTDYSEQGTRRVLRKIEERMESIYAMSQRGHHGHNTNRHIGLLAAWKAERRRLERLTRLEAAE